MSATANLRARLRAQWGRLQSDGLGAVLARGASGAFGVAVAGTALAFVAQLILARVMGVTQYGMFVYALTWISVLSLFAKLGLDTSLVRFVAAYRAEERWGLLRGVLGRSVLYVSVASLAVALLAAAVVFSLRTKMAPEQLGAFLVAFVLLPAVALTGLRQGALRALKRVVLAALPDSVIRPLLLALMAGALFLWSGAELSAPRAMTLNLAAALIAFAIGTRWLLRALPQPVREAAPEHAGRHWLSVSLPMFAMSGMYLILRQTDTIMVGLMLGPAEVGVYAVTSRLAGLVSFGKRSADAILAPMIAELYGTGRRVELQRVLALGARGVFVFTAFVGAGLALAGSLLLGLFGEAFVAGYAPLLVLLVGQAFKALFGSAGYLMTMTGHQNPAAVIVTVSAAANVALNLLLIPALGLVGAALATAAANVLWSLAMVIWVRRRLALDATVFATP